MVYILYYLNNHLQKELIAVQAETEQTNPQTEARSFIKNHATSEDLQQLQQLIQQRIDFLNSQL